MKSKLVFNGFYSDYAVVNSFNREGEVKILPILASTIFLLSNGLLRLDGFLELVVRILMCRFFSEL